MVEQKLLTLTISAINWTCLCFFGQARLICINQSDFDKKTQQVRMMRDIYANANQVIVWLGERQPEDAEAIAFAVWLFENFEKRLNVYSSKVPEGGDFRSAASKYPHILETPE